MARKMKDSGIEWVGEIPAHWDTTRIKNLFVYRNEKNYEPLNEVNLISLYTDLGVVQHSDLESTTGNKASNADGYKLVYEDDIVVNIILCWMGAIGRSAYTGVTSPAYDIYAPMECANSKFYHYLFRTKGFSGDCYKYGRGIMAMRWRTYSDQFRAIRVVMPPLDEQKKIAEFLDKQCAEIDAVIAKTKATIEEYKKLKQSIITDAVTKGIRGDRVMKESGVEWIDNIPSEWDVSRTKILFTFGKGLPITKENLVEKGVAVISYGQIHSKTNSGTTLNDDLFRFVSEDYLTTNANSLVQKNDFIVADTSEDLDGCGNCAFVDSDMTLFAGYHTIILHSNTDDDNKYFAYLFKTDGWRKQIRSKVSGVKLFSISKKILSDTTLLLPSCEERKEIVSYLDKQCSEIDNIISQKTALLAEMEAYKKSVIYEYVTGKKEVL